MRPREIAEKVRLAAAMPIDEGLQAVIRLAMKAGDWSAGSMTSADQAGSMRTVAHVGARAIEGDRWQSSLGEGPAYDAAHGGLYQFAGDLREDNRWGLWPSRAIAIGIVSTLSIRVHTVGTLGTLNLYSAQQREADAEAFECADMVASIASVFLARFNAEQQFVQAVQVGTVIGQAQGILMQRHQLSSDMALAVLCSISDQNGIEIAELAQHLVATGELS